MKPVQAYPKVVFFAIILDRRSFSKLLFPSLHVAISTCPFDGLTSSGYTESAHVDTHAHHPWESSAPDKLATPRVFLSTPPPHWLVQLCGLVCCQPFVGLRRGHPADGPEVTPAWKRYPSVGLHFFGAEISLRSPSACLTYNQGAAVGKSHLTGWTRAMTTFSFFQGAVKACLHRAINMFRVFSLSRTFLIPFPSRHGAKLSGSFQYDLQVYPIDS